MGQMLLTKPLLCVRRGICKIGFRVGNHVPRPTHTFCRVDVLKCPSLAKTIVQKVCAGQGSRSEFREPMWIEKATFLHKLRQFLSQNVWFFVTTILPFILPFWQEADMFNYARYFDTLWERVYGIDI
jgi:hypothetical protein